MKKSLMFMIITLFLLGMSGCAQSSDSVESIPVESTPVEESLDELTVKGHIVEPLSYDAPMFDAEISNIEIDIPQRQIHFDYEIKDYSNMYRYYFVYSYEVKDHRPFHPISSINFKPSSHYTLRLLYDENNSSLPVTIQMGRYSSSAHIIGEIEESNSVGFRYTIKDIQDRFTIEDDYFYFFPKVQGSSNGMTNLSIIDEHETISSVKFVLTEVFNDNAYIDEMVMDITPDLRKEGKVHINQPMFSDLEVGVRYQVAVYVSGNDGIYDFIDILVDKSQSVF